MDVLLKYDGRLADRHELDFYDAGKALSGFQRSLALTVHLVVNGEIITQAPTLKGARIIVTTPRPGSWEVVATIVGSLWATGTASKDSPFGHILYSVYDYVVRQTLGFPVDYSKSLFQSYADELEVKGITPAKLDSLTEKIENSLADMHRPVVASKTANRGDLYAGRDVNQRIRLGAELNEETYSYIRHNEIDPTQTDVTGVVSSYNINTYAGRLFVFDEERTIPFEIEDYARSVGNIEIIATSLRLNAIERGSRDGTITLSGRRVTSSTGRLKGFRASKALR